MRRRLLALMAAACCCAAAHAMGEDARRLAAEVVVIGGDLRRLNAGAGRPLERPLERAGLEQRIAGALSSLPLLLRRAGDDPAPAIRMREALARKDWRALASALSDLRRRHPFDARPLLPPPTTPLRANGKAIHASTCAGCHDADGGDSLLPAKKLSAWIKTMPREEFAARLLLGVRGDRLTGWRNPFSDTELAALIAFYDTAP